MAAREPTRHQLSSRLAYNAQTPAFLRKLQNQVAGRLVNEDEDEPQYLDDIDEFGRERRPQTPEPPGNNDEDFGDEDAPDERPTVVVLKEGKHLNEDEVENEKRKAKGLPPLPPRPSEKPTTTPVDNSTLHPTSGASKNSNTGGLSFSSTKNKVNKSSVKRKAPDGKDKFSKDEQPQKKKRKDMKGLLSFSEVM